MDRRKNKTRNLLVFFLFRGVRRRCRRIVSRPSYLKKQKNFAGPSARRGFVVFCLLSAVPHNLFPSLRFIYGFHLRLVCWMDSKIDDAKKTSSLPVEWNAGWPMNVCEQALTGAQRLTPRFCYFL